MREIKFRALSMCNGERWVYGDLRHYARNPHTEKWTIHDPTTGLETDIDETTIGQFTGLHDKDGRDIYEGDLVEMMRTSEKMRKRVMTRHIVTSDSVTTWTFRSLTKQVLGLCMSGMGDFDSYRFKVVGNIYDNPEMVQQVSLSIPERKPRRNSGKVKIEFVTKYATISTHVSQETAQALVKEMSRHS